MATAYLSFYFPLLPKLSLPRYYRFGFSVLTRNTVATVKTCATGGDLVGDFESGCAEKVVGNVDTGHKILVPNISAVSLPSKSAPLYSPLQNPMSKDDAEKLLKKQCGTVLLLYWKVETSLSGVSYLRRLLKSGTAGQSVNDFLAQV
ncbi:hypothetical protein P3X46_023608 [Hevea brasiliensis]|uniref:Uncharacterized protein n=1 Tax=Hevea brasiliensis TaxID=3981 RepID=A0ABQ9LEY4_HEVBR|nr:hypothetical protein P3X46_023608 [Hevea brasiliensis]